MFADQLIRFTYPIVWLCETSSFETTTCVYSTTYFFPEALTVEATSRTRSHVIISLEGSHEPKMPRRDVPAKFDKLSCNVFRMGVLAAWLQMI